MKSLLIFALSATSLIAAPAALADEPTKVIEFNARDLATEAGREGLRVQIENAAERVCIAPHRPTLRERRLQMNCVSQAIASGEAQLERKIAELEARSFAQVMTSAQDRS